MLLLQQMLILFLIMIVGFILSKIKIISSEKSIVISGIVVNVSNPALILSAGINKTETVEGGNLLLTVLLAIGIYAFLILWALLIPMILRIDKTHRGTYRVMTVFSNIGFMGFPIISAVYGEQALLYASVFLIPYNILIYTWGIMAMKSQSSKEGGLKENVKKILNVGVIASILTIVFYLTKVQVPSPIESTIKHFSNLTAPLSMMVIGAFMGQMKLKELFTDVKMILFLLIRLLIVPVAGVLILKQSGIDKALIGVCLIMLATPVGSMTAMLAKQYDGDYELASKGVSLSTFLSVATMPLLSFVLAV